MNRRDIIIIAVLVNAGLLALIFMLATNSDEDSVREPTELISTGIELPINQEVAAEPIVTPEATHIITQPAPDSVDEALKEYLDANTASQPIVMDDDSDSDEEPPKLEESATKSDPEKQESAATTSSSTGAKSKTIEITVKRGDSLDKIARANGTTIKAIKEASDLKSDRLNIGQVLRVPVGSKKAKEATTTAKKTTNEKHIIADSDAQFYTIKSGDNPWKIAKQFNIKVDDFLKLNNMSEDKARNLKIGDKVRIK